MGTLSPRDIALDAVRILADWQQATFLHTAAGHIDAESSMRELCQLWVAERLEAGGPQAMAMRLAYAIITGDPDVDLVAMLNCDAPLPLADDEPARAAH